MYAIRSYYAQLSFGEDNVPFAAGVVLHVLGDFLGGDQRLLQGPLAAAHLLQAFPNPGQLFLEILIEQAETLHLLGYQFQEMVDAKLVIPQRTGFEPLLLDVDGSQRHALKPL